MKISHLVLKHLRLKENGSFGFCVEDCSMLWHQLTGRNPCGPIIYIDISFDGRVTANTIVGIFLWVGEKYVKPDNLEQYHEICSTLDHRFFKLKHWLILRNLSSARRSLAWLCHLLVAVQYNMYIMILNMLSEGADCILELALVVIFFNLVKAQSKTGLHLYGFSQIHARARHVLVSKSSHPKN